MRFRISSPLAAAVLVLAACQPAASPGQSPGASPGESPQGRAVDEDAISGEVVLSGWTSSPAEQELLEQVLADFEAQYPNITLNYQPIATEYPASMLAKFSAGEPPDLFYIDSSVAPTWIDQDLIEPLDDYIAGNPEFDVGGFFPNMLAAFQVEGRTYGLPKDGSPLAMVYNPEMLDAAGIEPPTNWDELVSAAETLTTGGVIGLCLAPELARLGAFIYQNGGSIYNEDKTELTIGSAESREAIDFYLDFIKNGTGRTPTQLGSGWCGEAFGKQQVAIAFEGNWVVSALDDGFPETPYELAELPQGVQPGNLTFTVSYSIGVDSANKDQAWVLLQYLTGPEGMEAWTSRGLALPSRSDVPVPEGREALVAGLEYGTAWSFTTDFSEVNDAFNNALTGAIESGGSSDEIVAATEAAAGQ